MRKDDFRDRVHPAREMDVARIARLANLPLSDDERAELEADCAAVLDAFSLHDETSGPDTAATCPTFEDEPAPWPADGVEAIVEQFPQRDGRHLST